MGEWQLIETAPKDGRAMVLSVRRPTGPIWVQNTIGWWCNGKWVDKDGPVTFEPSIWLPLPRRQRLWEQPNAWDDGPGVGRNPLRDSEVKTERRCLVIRKKPVEVPTPAALRDLPGPDSIKQWDTISVPLKDIESVTFEWRETDG